MNTVPASVRCTPSTRMSLTVNGSNASAAGTNRADSNTTSNANHVLILPDARGATARAPWRASKEAGKIIEKRQSHQQGQHGHADALADLEDAVGNGTAFENLDQIIQQVSAIE